MGRGRKLTGQEQEVFDAFNADFAERWICWACGVQPIEGRSWASYTPGLDFPRSLVRHHIVGGSGRKHRRENLSLLCQLCHELVHGATVRPAARGHASSPLPILRIAHVLWLKRARDRGGYSHAALCEIARRRLPEPLRPPEWFEQEWGRHQAERRFEPIRGEA